MMRLILLGAPGAGKGTQAEFITRALSIPSISTGNLLREAIKIETELGKKAKEYMDAGALVPDDVVIGMVRERLAQDDCKNGCIFDGFPRTVAQAEALDKILDVTCALSIEVPDEAIEERMSGRRVCLKCGATYHVKSNPPEREGVCTKCGDALVIRPDDKAEVVRDRLKTYHTQTEPVKGYYAAQGKLKTVDGTGSVSEITGRISAVLGI